MKWLVKESKWANFRDSSGILPRALIQIGWGNGYVVLDKGHPWHGMDYDEIPVTIHGGLTYGEVINEMHVGYYDLTSDDMGKYIIGFDTAHLGDSLELWPKEKVELEAMNLLSQCLEVEK